MAKDGAFERTLRSAMLRLDRSEKSLGLKPLKSQGRGPKALVFCFGGSSGVFFRHQVGGVRQTPRESRPIQKGSPSTNGWHGWHGAKQRMEASQMSGDLLQNFFSPKHFVKIKGSGALGKTRATPRILAVPAMQVRTWGHPSLAWGYRQNAPKEQSSLALLLPGLDSRITNV